MDDSSVSQVGLNEVLSQKAYVLFYVRCPESAPMSKPMTPQLVSFAVLPEEMAELIFIFLECTAKTQCCEI